MISNKEEMNMRIEARILISCIAGSLIYSMGGRYLAFIVGYLVNEALFLFFPLEEGRK